MRTGINSEGIIFPYLDLSTVDADEADDGRLFRHNGNSTIDIEDDQVTDEKGIYSWDNDNNWWVPSGRYSQFVGGYSEDQLAKQTDHNTLRSDHDTLRSDHDTLRTDHNTLQDEKDQLRTDHDNLDSNFSSHESNTENPHDVTNTQVGAPTQESHDTLRSDHDSLQTDHDTLRSDHDSLRVDNDTLRDDFDVHDNSTDNPHEVTYDQVNAIPSADKGSAGGVAELGSDRKVPDSQLPSLAVTDVHVLDSTQTHTDLTSAEQGDMAVYANDADKGTYILSGSDPTVDSNWTEIDHPESPVQTVFGRTGDITASSGDYSIDQIDNGVHADTFQSLESDVSTNADNISFNETDISNLDDRVTTNEGDISTLDSNQSTLRSDFDSHTTTYDNHASDSAAHHAKYTNSEARTAVDGSDISITGTADSTQTDVDNHIADTNNPHNVTADEIGGIHSDSVGNIYVGQNEPSNPEEYDIWIRI